MKTEPTLFIVATPIGNLSDLSARALDVLKNVDFILCEDTRHTRKLLLHFHFDVPLLSLHEHNEEVRSQKIIAELLESPTQTAALVSDAGTPAISDPGSFFVEQCHKAGIKILSIPGPSALPSALAACGFREPRMVFSAFLERKKAAQFEEFLKWQSISPCIACFYESPLRLGDTLANLSEYFGEEIELCVSKEISKIHESHKRNSVGKILSLLEKSDETCGEYVIVVHVPHKNITKKEILSISEALAEVVKAQEQGLRVKDVIKTLSKENNLDAKELYRLYQEHKHAPLEG